MQAHETGSWFLLVVLFKTSDVHPSPFHMGFPQDRHIHLSDMRGPPV